MHFVHHLLLTLVYILHSKLSVLLLLGPLIALLAILYAFLTLLFYYFIFTLYSFQIHIRSYLLLSYNLSYYHINMKNSAWTKGPLNHIVCQPPHDRPIFCLAVSDNNFVTGSADHGLR